MMVFLHRFLIIIIAVATPTCVAMAHQRVSAQHALRPSAAPDYWPSARGRVGSFSDSPYVGPANISATSLAWSWHHPEGRFHTVTLGVLIDGQESVYLAADDAVRKFTKDGQPLWTYTPQGRIPTNPSLLDGALFGSTSNGRVFSVDMSTGEERWSVKVAKVSGTDTSFVTAHDGIVVAASDAEGALGSNRVVRGLNATDGSSLWEFRPDAAIWNFMALPAGDGTFIFQDIEGRAYRHNLTSGEMLWKAGGVPGTHTDGTALLGPNGIVYSVAIGACCCGPCGVNTLMQEDTPGWLTAFNFSDGAQLWQQRLARPPNTFPAVGRLAPWANYSVVIPVGQQCSASQTDVYAFDAATGAPQWLLVGPKNPRPYCAGDLEGLQTRMKLRIRGACLPNPWSAPTIDAVGAIYAGNQDGKFYRFQDANMNGRMEPGEMTSYDTEAAFSAPGSAHSPSMIAVASCDGLFVFKK